MRQIIAAAIMNAPGIRRPCIMAAAGSLFSRHFLVGVFIFMDSNLELAGQSSLVRNWPATETKPLKQSRPDPLVQHLDRSGIEILRAL